MSTTHAGSSGKTPRAATRGPGAVVLRPPMSFAGQICMRAASRVPGAVAPGELSWLGLRVRRPPRRSGDLG